MIHSASPTVSPIISTKIYVFEKFYRALYMLCFAIFRKVRTDGHVKMITTGRDCGLADWIKRESKIIEDNEVTMWNFRIMNR